MSAEELFTFGWTTEPVCEKIPSWKKGKTKLYFSAWCKYSAYVMLIYMNLVFFSAAFWGSCKFWDVSLLQPTCFTWSARHLCWCLITSHSSEVQVCWSRVSRRLTACFMFPYLINNNTLSRVSLEKRQFEFTPRGSNWLWILTQR